MKASFFASLVMAAVAAGAIGSEPACCPDCGCGSLVKVCKMVPDVKKETQTRWTCVCEDICLPGRSRRCGEVCVPDPQARGGARCETVWEPTCGPVVTRKKLKKETVTVEKPGFKCVVETVCGRCGAACGQCGTK